MLYIPGPDTRPQRGKPYLDPGDVVLDKEAKGLNLPPNYQDSSKHHPRLNIIPHSTHRTQIILVPDTIYPHSSGVLALEGH